MYVLALFGSRVLLSTALYPSKLGMFHCWRRCKDEISKRPVKKHDSVLVSRGSAKWVFVGTGADVLTNLLLIHLTAAD